jgi:signal transduction histidine kinase
MRPDPSSRPPGQTSASHEPMAARPTLGPAARLRRLGRAAGALAAGTPAWLQAASYYPAWLPPRWRRPLVGYLAAVALQGLLELFTAWQLAAIPTFQFPGTLSLLGVVLVALAFGAGPSLVAALLGGALLVFDVLPPPWGAPLLRLSDAFTLGLLAAVGMLIGALVSRVEHARREAAAAVAARDTFLSLAAHELRTPLTVYMSAVELAEQRARRAAEDARRRGLEIAHEVEALAAPLALAHAATARQDRLVHELLDVARIQAGTLQLHVAPCDLAAIMRAASAEQQHLHPDRALRLDLPAGPVDVVADGERIGQVVTDYLSNALKYAPADQPVDVTLTVTTVTTVTTDTARVAVRDRGPGLSPEEQARVWELYRRVPCVAVASGSDVGLGLGLYLCRAIVLAHPGGQVGVESAVGAGSTFWFSLPLAPEP